MILKKDEMSQDNYNTLIARIRTHCQQVIQDAGPPHSGWMWKGAGWAGEYIDKHNSFITLKKVVSGEEPSLAFPPATEQQLKATERQLGFSLPPLLRLLYTQIANGGFGPGYGITGVIGGYPCIDAPWGDIAQRYQWEIDFANAIIQLARGGWRSLTPEARQVLWDDGIGSKESFEAEELDGMEIQPEREVTWHSPWPEHLLPFCEWGCNIVTYIHVESGQIFQGMRGPDLLAATSLEEWLERWLAGESLQLM
jgi:hypothetical protein